ncbi:MAG: hypothetical protein ACRD68_14740, partial [Pyrinomonadaceae bacterium]
LQLLADAPLSVGAPIVIEKLIDPDGAIRGTAFASLQTAALPLDDTFGYDPGEPHDELVAGMQRWRQWWAAHRRDALHREVPKMLADLDSPNPLKRLAADWSLRLVSGREVGFQAEAPLERRREAGGRWKTWWGEASLKTN